MSVLPPVGALYNSRWNNIAWTQPSGPGSQVFPTQNVGPWLTFPVPGQFWAETGLWTAGCQHWFDDWQIFRDYDDSTHKSAAIQCCPICTYIIAIIEPFELTETKGQFDIIVSVEGGGTAAQADAVRLGISRALVRSTETLRPTLRKAGMLTRDPREVERKKYGHHKARKRPQYSKR